jgi:hypothetical protein
LGVGLIDSALAIVVVEQIGASVDALLGIASAHLRGRYVTNVIVRAIGFASDLVGNALKA